MGNREELLALFKENPRLAELNARVAAQVLSGKTPESLIPARLPHQKGQFADSEAIDALGRVDPPNGGNGIPEGLNVSPAKPRKARKYRNQPVELDNYKFDSFKEAKRYSELKLLERAGKIENLQVHPKYEFYHNNVRLGSFKPDFSYKENGEVVIEDVKAISKTGKKPTVTDGYRLRRNMLKAFYNLDVREI
jgi:hypothetical protein